MSFVAVKPCKPSCRDLSLDQTNIAPVLWQGLNNAVALDFDYRQQMIYWTDVTTQGSMIRRMHINGSDVQVSVVASWQGKIGYDEIPDWLSFST